ncbi:MAG: hypothetical protein ACD_29C00157G0002 [uncultured bacterium]|nr:MAG: hypothetical protein ACD_29C00157G0002 [uncultured bacterium]
MMTEIVFNKTLVNYRNRINHTLSEAIASHVSSATLAEAMRYSTIDCGKRLRPILVYAAGECFGQSLETLDAIAAAIECIHCYSLMHDDLPAMDDDNLRRNKPTSHIVFGEAIAILAGDALQALAFELLSANKKTAISPQNQLKIIEILAKQAGASGMVGGQTLDLLAEGKTISSDAVIQIHTLKTGALIKAGVIMGALAAGCDNKLELNTLDQFSSRIGLAFQLQDDLFDMIGNSKTIGKNTGQDSKHQKATYPILFGSNETKNKISVLLNEALIALKTLQRNTSFLKMVCQKMIIAD